MALIEVISGKTGDSAGEEMVENPDFCKIVIYNEKRAIIFNARYYCPDPGSNLLWAAASGIFVKVFDDSECECSHGKIFIASGKPPNPVSFIRFVSIIFNNY
jgi:hypothetical protein